MNELQAEARRRALERIAAVERSLRGQRVAIETFDGTVDGGHAVTFVVGTRLPARSSIVMRYPDHFGPIPEKSIRTQLDGLWRQLDAASVVSLGERT